MARYVYGLILIIFAVLAFYFASRVFFNKNYTKPTFAGFAVTAFGSGLWSSGYAFMLILSDDSVFLVSRAIGIVGLFLFLFAAQYLIGIIAKYPRKVFFILGFEVVAGVVVCTIAVNPGSITLTHTENGIVTSFVNQVVSIVYTVYTLFVAFCFIAASINMLRSRYPASVRSFGRNLLIVEGLIILGMVVDTVLPAAGINLNIPASTMLQFIGLDILYHAIHRVNRNDIISQNLAEYTYTSLKAPIIVFDSQNRIVIINQEARKVFDLADKDITRDDFWGTLLHMDSPFHPETPDQIIESEAFYEKGQRNLRLYIDPIRNNFGEYPGYILMVSDITALHQYTLELEKSKDEALRANKAKSQFLANMSHEIRTPMNSIIGFSELALKEDMPEESAGYVNDIHESAKTLLAIINDILDISKIESGKMELVEGEYNPAYVFSEVSKVIEVLAHKNNLYFHSVISPDFPNRLKGDKLKVRAILTNILNNGIKYTKAGGVTLKADFQYEGTNKGKVILMISDTGIGIKKEELSSIFDSFQRVDLSANSATEGTGLGLSITKGFVDLMGGSIKVDSEYGMGTTFTVTFEQEIIEIEKPQPVTNGRKVEVGKTLHLKDTTILAVDDTPLNLKLIRAILIKYGAKVDLARGGEESIEMCSKKDYDMVLMDQMMPVVDGVMAMKEIRKIGRGYESGGARKIVALTANVIDGARDERIDEGFDDFLGKPINVEWLEIVLTKYLREDQYDFS